MSRFPFFPALLAVVGLLTLPPVTAQAAEYTVRAGSHGTAAVAGMARLAPALSPLGLVPRQPLVNLPDTLVAEMPPETARLLALQGYEVHALPVLHLDQDGAPWPLDRIDQRALPLDGSALHPYTGRGVRIFVLDGSIYPGLPEFEDRLVESADFLGDGVGVLSACGGIQTHATAVASAAVGKVYGVAPGATVSVFRISDCTGSVSPSAELAALDALVSWKKVHPTVPAIVNMSYSGAGTNPAEEALFQQLDALGVLLVTAAGNHSDDACSYVPASSPETLAVGISDVLDQRPPRSDFGPCVDLFAPGKDVTVQGGPQPVTGSGTSISAPFVVGTLALLAEQLPDLPSPQLRRLLLLNATQGALVGDLGPGSPNLLLYDGPVQEEVTRFIPRWFPTEHRFTVQIGVSIHGSPTLFPQVRLYRGPRKDGHCQGAPYATVTLGADGSAVSTVVGFQQAPAFLCVETARKTVFDRFVRTLG